MSAAFLVTEFRLDGFGRILMDLQGNEDPIWIYFDNQHKYILDQINKTFKSAVANIECQCRSRLPVSTGLKFYSLLAAAESVADNSPVIAHADRARAKEIYAAMLAVETKQADVVIGKVLYAVGYS